MQYIISQEDIEFLKRWREIGAGTYDDRINSLDKKTVTKIASGTYGCYWDSPAIENDDDITFLDSQSAWHKYTGKNITIYVEVNDAKR